MQLIAKNGITAILFTFILTSTTIAFAYSADHDMLTPNSMKWMNGPASLPKGAQVSILEGDPNQAGPFTLRLKFPANYRIPPHWHPAIEHITVLSGELYLGTGDEFNKKQTKVLPAGSFAFMPVESHHFVYTLSPTVLQLHGVGPWEITYINKDDDPRNAKQ